MTNPPPSKYNPVVKASHKKRDDEDSDSICIKKSEERIESDAQTKKSEKSEKSSFIKSQEKSFLQRRRNNSDRD